MSPVCCRPACILPILALAASAGWTDSRPEEEPVYTAPTVLVSASRIDPVDFSSTGRRTLVLNREEIRRLAPRTITDLLAALPGVDARVRGPFGVQTDLEMGGATFRQVLILVDGMRVNDPQTGHHTLNLPLSPEDLDRVEILYGPGSSVHGPDAFGGVINLVTRREPVRRVDVSSRWGRSLDDSDVVAVGSDAALRYGWQRGSASLWVAAGKSRSDGYRSGTSIDADRFYLSGSVAAAGGELRLQGGVEKKDFGANDFYAPFASGERTRAWLYQARFSRSSPSGERILARIYYRRHRDRFALIDANPDFYLNRHLNQLGGVEVFGTVAAGTWGQVIAGGESVRETIESNNLGEHDQNRGALFAEYGGGRGRWQLNAGIRTDRHERFGWEASPSVGVTYQRMRTRWFASVGRSYRAPSFTDLYYSDPANIGNADLGAERAWSYESGVRFPPLGGVRTQIAGFARYENNVVDFVRPVPAPPDEAPQPWTARNLGEMRTAGVEMRLWRAWGAASLDAAYTFIDKQQTLGAALQSKFVFTHPRHLFSLRLDHQLPAGLDVGWQVRAKEREFLEDYAVVDLVISRSFAYGRSLLRVSNLTDEPYEAVRGVPQPGRWVSVETQFEL